MRACIALIALLLLCACGAAVPTPTPTPVPTSTPLPTATLGPVQQTAAVIRQHDYATQAARMVAGCERVRQVYANYGQPFDSRAVGRDPQGTLAEMLAMSGVTDTRSLMGGTLRNAYWGYIKDCAGL